MLFSCDRKLHRYMARVTCRNCLSGGGGKDGWGVRVGCSAEGEEVEAYSDEG